MGGWRGDGRSVSVAREAVQPREIAVVGGSRVVGGGSDVGG